MKTVLAIAAHPDDIEFLMSGTMMLLQKAGYTLHYFNLANGSCGTTERGTAETVRIRHEEARAAAKSLGATFYESICDDLGVFYDRPTLARVASVVRAAAPRILLTHAPSDYMEDHMNACRLAVTAAFARCMPNFLVDPPRAATSHPVTVYHAQPYMHRDPLGRVVEPDLFVDISEVSKRKAEVLALHASQRRWLAESQGHDSYLDTMRELDEECGRMSGLFPRAEGWRRHLHVGFCGPGDDPLAQALQGLTLVAGERARP